MIGKLRPPWPTIVLVGVFAIAGGVPTVLLGIGIVRDIPSNDIPIIIGGGILIVTSAIGILASRLIRQASSEPSSTGEALDLKLEQEG